MDSINFEMWLESKFFLVKSINPLFCREIKNEKVALIVGFPLSQYMQCKNWGNAIYLLVIVLYHNTSTTIRKANVVTKKSEIKGSFFYWISSFLFAYQTIIPNNYL